MSDSDDDESFGPAPPPSIAAIPLQTTEMRPEVPSSNGVDGSQLAAVQHTPLDGSDAATSRSNDVAASPMRSKRARESDELLVTNQGNKERYSLALQSDYDRSFLHNGTIIGVACATWSDGVQLVTLDASGILRWWIKLPMRGYLLAKEVNVAPASVGTASCEGSLFLLQSGCLREPQSAERTALVDLKEGTVRLLHGDLMEIGPRLPLPWSFAATVMPTPDVRPQLLLWHDPKGQGSATTLIAALHNEPKIVAVGLTSRMGSIEDDASSNASRMTAMMSGTMHPIKLMECHCLSGLLVVVDSCGIVDYVHIASSTTSDDVAWRTVRGLDELSKQKGGSVPSWARHVSFATRTKTSFFAAFRAKHAPIGLSVSERALLLSCSSGQDVVHYCLDFSSGKLIGTYTQRLSCPTPATVIVPPRWEACPMSHCVSSSSGGVEMEWWCVPSSHGSSLVLFGFPRGCDSKSIGSGTSTDVVTDNFVLAGPPNTAADEGDGGELMIMMMPLLAHVSTVRPSQQLRNMIARSQLGSGLTADTINGLMGGGGTSSTRSAEMKGEVSLVAACGPHLVFFSSVERGTAAAHRDFTCADISKSLGFNFLQKGDADNEIESLPSASTAAEAAQRVYATITIKGSETTPLQFRLLPFIAPLAVQNFRALAEAGFFRGLTFHRVIKEFMLQGGCPKGDGTGGQCLLPGGGPFRDEFVGAGTTDPLGELDVGGIGSMRTKYLLCMANSGPNTNSSQFFITTAPTPWLAKHHTIFGVLACPPPQEGDCTAMQHLLHTLESVEVDREAKPKRPIVISDVAVTTLSDST